MARSVPDPAADLLTLLADGWVLTSRDVEEVVGCVRFYMWHRSGERCRINVPLDLWRSSASLMRFELAVA